MGVLDELEQAVVAALAAAGNAVVGIGRGWGLGSGVVVGDGLVLTNAHNLRDSDVSVTFAGTFAGGRTERGEIAALDLDGDLAVIRVATGDAAAIAWEPGAEASLVPGSVVIALANPGGRGLRATLGQVSAVGRTFRGPRGRKVTGTIEHTAPLVKGSSGGPIVDRSGRFVGLNTNRLGEGFYAALPAGAELRAQVDALAGGHAPRRVSLGIGILPARAARNLRRSVGLPDRDGVLVGEVDPGGPAGRAGLRRGDLLVAAAGLPVSGVDDLHAALAGAVEAESLVLAVVRGTDELSVEVAFEPAGE